MEGKRHSSDRGHNGKHVGFSEDVPDTPRRPSHTTLKSSTTSFPHDITEARDAVSSHKLYVSNLPQDSTFADLQAIFPNALSIVLENRTTDTKNAIVEFGDLKDCNHAFQTQKNSKLRGRLLIIAPKTTSLD